MTHVSTSLYPPQPPANRADGHGRPASEVTVFTRVPLRVTLGGGGTDLPAYFGPFGGFVVSVTIDKHSYVTLTRTAADADVRAGWSGSGPDERFDPVTRDLLLDACRRCVDDRAGLRLHSACDVPVGTGLGSSGSFTVGVIAAIHAARGDLPDPVVLAREAYRAESELAGRAGGIQDAYLPCLGGLLALRISADGTVEPLRLAVEPGLLDELDNSLLLYFTGISRSSEDMLAAQQRMARSGFAPTLQSMHHCKDISLRVSDALEAGDLDAIAALLHEHWIAKRDVVGGVTTPRIDRLYDLARTNGALGGKLVGAGGGGYLLLYCPPSGQRRLRSALSAEGLRELRFRFTSQGLGVFCEGGLDDRR